MISYDDIMDIAKDLKEVWGENGERVFVEAFTHRKEISMSEFLSHCIMCGGNWGGMFLSGLKELYPTVWEAIPDNMGMNGFVMITNIILLCGVNFEK